MIIRSMNDAVKQSFDASGMKHFVPANVRARKTSHHAVRNGSNILLIGTMSGGLVKVSCA